MDIEPVDPRDIGWEDDNPTFRVTFWERRGSRNDTMWSRSDYDVKGAGVDEILAWAKAKDEKSWSSSESSTAVVTVKVLAPAWLGRRGAIRILGAEPRDVG